MNDALLVTALGMGIVFLVLMIICGMIAVMGKMFSSKKAAAPAPKAAPAPTAAPAVQQNTANDEEVVAAIMAAVSAYMGGQSFRINAITPLVVRPMVRNSETSPWTAAGISENNHR